MNSTNDMFIQALIEVVGVDGVSISEMESPRYVRRLNALGGGGSSPQDHGQQALAVVLPAGVQEVSRVVEICSDSGVAIVPFGNGNGRAGELKSHRPYVMIDLKRMNAIRDLDVDRRRVEVEAGLTGKAFEQALDTQGVTLGHFPFLQLSSSVGGWIATRSAGQCSSRYGKISDMVVELEFVGADGVIRTTSAPSAGLDWAQIIIGSEGTLGIITAVTLLIHPVPSHRVPRGWLLPTVAAGVEVMRRTMQDGLRPAVLRLYDVLDTRLMGIDGPEETSGGVGALKSLLSGSSAAKGIVLRKALGTAMLAKWASKRWGGPVLLVTVAEGSGAEAEETDALIAEHAWALGGLDQGEKPGMTWLEHLDDLRDKQSEPLEMNACFDTIEVAASWDRVAVVYDAVRKAVRRHVIVMAHFSHAYPGGCSIRFTMAARPNSSEKRQRLYAAAWSAAFQAAQSAGATVASPLMSDLPQLDDPDGPRDVNAGLFLALKKTMDPMDMFKPGVVLS